MRILHLDKNHEYLSSELEKLGFENHYDYTSSNPYYQSVSSPQEIDALLSAINVLLIDGFSVTFLI